MFARLALGAAFFLAGCLTALAQSSTGARDWPQWRGPNRDNVSRETGLLKEWPESGPPVLWRVDNVGVGYASLAVKDGRVFTQGDVGGVEHVIALNEKDGSLLWARQPEPVQRRLDERVTKEFAAADQNGDGVIDEAEALARIGWNFNNSDEADEGNVEEIASQRAQRLLEALDKDGDRQLTFAEAGQAFRDVFANIDRAQDGADEKTLAKRRADAFVRELDGDNDGKIGKQEARRTLLDRPFRRIDQKLPGQNEGDDQLTPPEIEQYLLQFEAGFDGLISEGELAGYFARTFPGADGQLTKNELRGYYGGYRNGRGDGPRGTPTIEGDRVYVEGGNGDLSCLEAATGETIWSVNLSSDLGGRRPGWGYSESPLLVGDLLLVTPGGGDGCLAALNKETGEVVWRSENTQPAHYSSPVYAEINGVPQIVQFARESLFAAALKDGRTLWTYSGANNGTANCATPIVEGNLVFASSAYGTGGALAKISGDGPQQAEEVYFEKKMANHHGGLVKVGDHLYGFGSGGLICMDFATGEIAWTARSVGKGSLFCADGMLYCLGERYEVALVEATPEEYRERGRFRIDDLGLPSWAHPVVAGGKFYIRNQHRLTAYDVSAR